LTTYENRVFSEIPGGVSIVEVDSQNIEDVREFRGESVLQEFHKFYAVDGCHGAYAYFEGAVIGTQWIEINMTKVCRLSQEGVLMLPGEGETWYAHVNEKYRGKRIVYGLRNAVYMKAKSLSCTKISLHVLEDNEASLRSHRSFGGVVSETRATILKTVFRLITIYKADDRWFVLLRLLWLRKGIVIAWSEACRFGLLLVKL
jgi:hypothetical protein